MASPVICNNFTDFFAAARAFQSKASTKYRAPSKNGDSVNTEAAPATKTFARVPSSSEATDTRRGSSSNGSDISATTVESPPSQGSSSYRKGNAKATLPPSSKTLRVKHQKYMAMTGVKLSFEEFVNKRFGTSPSSSNKHQNGNTRGSRSPTRSPSPNTATTANTQVVPPFTSISSTMYRETRTKGPEHPAAYRDMKSTASGKAPEHPVAQQSASSTSIAKAPEHPVARNSTNSLSYGKALERPGADGRAKNTKIEMEPEHPVSHKSANIPLVEKAPEHPVAYPESKPTVIAKAPEHPVAHESVTTSPVKKAPEHPVARNSAKSPSTKKALEHPGAHESATTSSVKKAPEHPVAHNSANSLAFGKALEHPGARNRWTTASVPQAPEHPVASRINDALFLEKAKQLVARNATKFSSIGLAPEHPVPAQMSKLASAGEVLNAKENKSAEFSKKNNACANEVEATGATKISSEVNVEVKHRMEDSNIAEKVPTVPTGTAPTDVGINTKDIHSELSAKCEAPRDRTATTSKNATCSRTPIAEASASVNLNNANVVPRKKETRIRFTTCLPRAPLEVKMSAADAGTKQIGMAVDVPKPLETKNTESGKATIIHAPSPHREAKAPKFPNGSGGDASVGARHLANCTSENAVKDDDAASSESDAESDVVVFKRDQSQPNHRARLAATTSLPQPDVAKRTVPVSEYAKLPQGTRSPTPVDNNCQRNSPEASNGNPRFASKIGREANGLNAPGQQNGGRSYDNPPDSRGASNGQTSKSPQFSQNTSSTARIRTLEEALSPEYRAMPRAERHALAAKEDAEETNRWLAMTPEERAADLKAIQEAQLAEARAGKYTMRARRAMNLEEDPASQMRLARQGPGTDPSSQISQEIRRRVLAEGKNKPIPYRPELTEMLRDPAEYFYADASFVRDDYICATYAPWNHEHFKSYDVKFRGWFDATTKLGYAVDTSSEIFKNGTGHCDGMADAFAVEFEDGIDYSLDETDPENARAHETSAGYAYNMTVRKLKEDAKNEVRVMISGSVRVFKVKPEVHPHAPKGKIYLRPVEDKDITALVYIYNWYIRGQWRVVDGDPITEQDVRDRIAEAEKANLPFLVAAEQQEDVWNALNSHDERIYGFAFATPTGASTFKRYSAELQVFVHPVIRRFGTAKCLIDKMLEICDPKYEPKGGYFLDCCPNKRDLYCGRYARYVTSLSYNVRFTDADSKEYDAYKLWLKKAYGFEESGVLKNTATKEGKPVHTGCLVYNTNVEPLTRRRRIEKP